MLADLFVDVIEAIITHAHELIWNLNQRLTQNWHVSEKIAIEN